MVRRRVDLPAPLGPSTAVMPRSGTRRLTPSSAVTPPYATCRPSTSSTGAASFRRGQLITEVCAGHRRVVLHVVRRPRSDHAAEVKNVHATANRHHEVQPVLDEGDRHPVAQPTQKIGEVF